jgi:hypothetical protein
VRHAGLDEDEVAGPVRDRVDEPGTVVVADRAFQDVQHDLEADVDVRVGDAARRHGGDVHREGLRADVLGRHALHVVDAVPLARTAPTADDGDAVVRLDW